jgi:hypothetical protein
MPWKKRSERCNASFPTYRIAEFHSVAIEKRKAFGCIIQCGLEIRDTAGLETRATTDAYVLTTEQPAIEHNLPARRINSRNE